MSRRKADARANTDSDGRAVRKRGVARSGGRPLELTPQLRDQLAKLISLGIPVRVACQAEGIGKTAYYEWRSRGAAGEEPYASFFAAINAARAKSEASITLNLISATKTDWRAAAWWLEKLRPNRYGKRQTVVLKKHPSQMTDEEIAAEIAKLPHADTGTAD